MRKVNRGGGEERGLTFVVLNQEGRKKMARQTKKEMKKAEEKRKEKDGHRHKVKPPHFIDQPFAHFPGG